MRKGQGSKTALTSLVLLGIVRERRRKKENNIYHGDMEVVEGRKPTDGQLFALISEKFQIR
jgi:hypothetical protein